MCTRPHTVLNGFTFHYVSISTFSHGNLYAHNVKFTFHYVSISTRRNKAIEMPAVFIYIPLCIYFNYTFLKWCGCFLIYLHSTMYLFQRASSDFTSHLVITFTFHYVSISTIQTVFNIFCKVIYIPLCIYFNLNECRNGRYCVYLHSTMYLFQQALQ